MGNKDMEEDSLESMEGLKFSAFRDLSIEESTEGFIENSKIESGQYAMYYPALQAIRELIHENLDGKRPGNESSGCSVIVGIDGRCGSGKSSFANWAAKRFECNLVHVDDYYLPLEERRDNWREIPGGNIDFDRLRLEVLDPAGRGREIYYRPYHCMDGKFGEVKCLAPSGLTIVEGSYSHHPCVADVYDLRIFLTCTAQVQAQRLQAREGSRYDMFVKQWIPMEENYFAHCHIEENSHLVVKT